MTYLSEDSTYLAGGLILLAGAFLVALKLTQQGKYLVHAGIALGLAILMVTVEWFWVTENEQIEQVVYELRQAVLSSDAEEVLLHMAPNIQYLQGDTALSEDATRAMIRTSVNQAQFDFVRISELQTSVGHQSRRGQAKFRVFTKGRLNSSSSTMGLDTAVTMWSLGFQETKPGVWKVNRISPIVIPAGTLALPSGLPLTDESHLSFNGGTGISRPRLEERHSP